MSFLEGGVGYGLLKLFFVYGGKTRSGCEFCRLFTTGSPLEHQLEPASGGEYGLKAFPVVRAAFGQTAPTQGFKGMGIEGALGQPWGRLGIKGVSNASLAGEATASFKKSPERGTNLEQWGSAVRSGGAKRLISAPKRAQELQK
jgi:hypothetical protein